ncbi:DHA2 family efflux MFS transporter permease subunit [Sphingomonas sp. ID0503]|uniref:DHA2 family efflux MFS transporter permease subunit n=1 Tax=Sphingomonas sp. ID0503 TaxID=3399691 RepID=UPI003AFA6CA2
MAGSADSAVLPANRRLLAGLVLALGNFMVVLDLTIANVSVPHIAGNLGISADQGTWVITSYAVAEAIFVPLTGWLVLRFGAVRMLTICMAGFGISSVLCGLSPTLGMLVASRILQGMFGGSIMPLTQTLLLRAFPPESRNRAMALWAMTTLLGPAAGPILGGYISDNWSWHWIFFINVPVCIACVSGTILLFKPLETATRKTPIDMVGLILMLIWIGSLQLMLDIGRDRDWFADPLVVALGLVAAIGLLVFIVWELTEEHPVVDLRIFRHRGFTFGVIALTLAFGAYFASIVIIPQWLQLSLGYPAMDAGLVTAFTALTALTTAQLVGKFMSKVDARILVSGGVAWTGLMALWRTQWTSGADFWTLALPQVVQGFGVPFFMIPLTAITLGSVRPEETASAAGLQNFLRTMAVAIATSLVLTEWGDNQRVARNEMAASLRPDDAQHVLSSAGFGAEQGRQVISNLVENEAVVLAVTHTFMIAAVIIFVSAAVVWLAPRPGGKVDMSKAH